MRVQKILSVLVLIGLLMISIGELGNYRIVNAEESEPQKATDGETSVEIVPIEPNYGPRLAEGITQDMVDKTIGVIPSPEPMVDMQENRESIVSENDLTSTSTNPNPERGFPSTSTGSRVFVLDSFDRVDGPVGSSWTVQNGYCNVNSHAAACGSNGLATFNNSPGGGNAAEVDVAAVGVNLQYAGLVLNYGAGISNIFVKVQQDNALGKFNKGACYTGNNGAPFGLGFFDLTSPFTTAHMKASRLGDSVSITFSNIDGGVQADQVYVCSGAPAPEGTGIGIVGFSGISRMDNFGVPAGPQVLLLEADDDLPGASPIQETLLAYNDLGAVDLFDAITSTPTLSHLQRYDVVVTWSNLYYSDPVGIGNVLADYVDSGGKVINMMFAVGTHGWQMQGRFMNENYTAINGTDIAYDYADLGTFVGSHPIMAGIAKARDYFRLTSTYLTTDSIELARWDDSELFVAVKNDRSVVTINSYVGVNSAWTGQMDDLLHNAIHWLYSNWVEISTDPAPRMDIVLAAYDGKVWSITGNGGDLRVSNYTPQIKSWTVVPGSEPPFGNNFARSGCQIADQVYVYGDVNNASFTGLWRYSITSNTWVQLTPLGTPPPYAGIWAPAWAADPDTGRCYLTGGATTPGGGNLSTVYVYDALSNQWLTPLPGFTTPRNFHAAFIYTRPSDGYKMLCVAGGINIDSEIFNSTQCYEFPGGNWHSENVDMGILPTPLWGMGYTKAVTATGDQLWLVNGVDETTLYPGTWFFDVNSSKWVDKGPLESGTFYRTSAVTLDGTVYHVGGSTGGFSASGLSDKYTGIWLPWYVNLPLIIK
jgi:hypothetical protein